MDDTPPPTVDPKSDSEIGRRWEGVVAAWVYEIGMARPATTP